jgi:hypothetical protein
VHFMWTHYLLDRNRHDDVPRTDKEIGQKGSVKLYRVPPVGLSSTERTELYRTASILAMAQVTGRS